MVTTAMETAWDWLQTAEVGSKAGLYAQSLYALEMAVEIAFKAVLISLDTDFPKVHDIEKTVRTNLSGNKKVPQKFLDELEDYLSTFGTLLDLRAPAGYVFEHGFKSDDLQEETKVLIPKCREILSACENAVKAAGKNGETK